jgi:starch phosphorylase
MAAAKKETVKTTAKKTSTDKKTTTKTTAKTTAKAPAKKAAAKSETKTTKAAAKPAAKTTTKAAAKPAAKAPAKSTAKTATKTTAKAPAKKASAKTAAKTTAKAPAKKAAAKTTAKAPAKKTAAKTTAKAPAKKTATKAVKAEPKKVKIPKAKKPTITFDKELFKRSVLYNVRTLYRKNMEEATPQQVFQAVSYAIKDQIVDYWMKTQEAYEREDPKTVYYLSMEFLMGRALGNNMINLMAYKDAKDALEELGVDINVIEDQEPDAALGNGGLGRLAACFLDSLATLGYSAYGCGIRYRYGMFKQEIRDGFQVEVPDNWLDNGNPFELRRPEYTKEVRFGGYVSVRTDEKGRNHYYQEGYQAVKAVPYDHPIVGYGNGIVNTLRIWDAEPVDCFRLDSFDKGDYQKAVEQENLARNIVEVLYPNDNHYAGKELRLKQQYFFISASVQEAVAKYMRNHKDIKKFYEKVTFQLNDTHPTVAIAELMRILMDEYYLTWDEAWKVTTRTCAYTNHTIMAEALEKWPIELFSRLLPRIYQIVEEINRRFIADIEAKYPGNKDKIAKMAIVYDGQVKMAHLAIVAGYSVNGVARLHTEILKNQELKDFYEMFPNKFNNKTNGITQRRFLLHGNPLLADWVTEHVGDEWITDLPKIKGLKVYATDKKAQAEFMNIKYKNKVRLAKYIKEHNGIDVDPRSIFDVQVKRLHEYKRQLLNILHIMYLYNEIKEHPEMEFFPRTFIFGAKAAAGYRNAKLTIKLINSVADVINNDKSIDGKIKVVFIENYRVSNAEIIFAAADVSEQISTASKEASGTGNMKFMLNGAVTIGTMDGANVEIVEEVGEDNAFIFGLSSDEVIRFENYGGYDPMEIFNNDPDVRKVLMQLINGTYSEDTELFRPLYNSLLNTLSTSRADTYFILKDFKSYAAAQKRVEEAYMDKKRWAYMAMMNVACSGKFTSDRTIKQYVDEIWHLDHVTL